jgi:anti-sigma-K factor RskA
VLIPTVLWPVNPVREKRTRRSDRFYFPQFAVWIHNPAPTAWPVAISRGGPLLARENVEYEALLAAVARQDRAAFRSLYDLAAPKLFATILRIVRSKAAAEEILQDVFLRVWQDAGRFSPETGHVWTKLERALTSRGAAPHRFRVIDGSAVPSDAAEGLRRSLRRWRAATALSSAVAAALLVFIGYRLVFPVAVENATQDATYVAAINRDGDQPALLVRVDLKTHSVFVRPVAAETPKGKSLELWYISDGKPPRSMGVVANAPLSLPLPSGTHAEAATFAVSVEPPGGSPSGVATGPVIYSGQLIKE